MFTIDFEKVFGMTREEYERRNKLWESKEAEREQLINSGDNGYNFIRFIHCHFIEKSERHFELYRNILYKMLANEVGESEEEVKRIVNVELSTRDIDEDGDECIKIPFQSKINYKRLEFSFKYKDELFDKYYQELKPQRRKKR